MGCTLRLNSPNRFSGHLQLVKGQTADFQLKYNVLSYYYLMTLDGNKTCYFCWLQREDNPYFYLGWQGQGQTIDLHLSDAHSIIYEPFNLYLPNSSHWVDNHYWFLGSCDQGQFW